MSSKANVRTNESAAGSESVPTARGEDKARKLIGISARHIATYYMLQQHYI